MVVDDLTPKKLEAPILIGESSLSHFNPTIIYLKLVSQAKLNPS